MDSIEKKGRIALEWMLASPHNRSKEALEDFLAWRTSVAAAQEPANIMLLEAAADRAVAWLKEKKLCYHEYQPYDCSICQAELRASVEGTSP